MKKVPCPHCGRRFAANKILLHGDSCPKAPEMARRLIDLLHCTARDGRILAQADYTELAEEHKLPSAYCLLQAIGPWDAVAAWAGLLPHLPDPPGEYRTRDWFEGSPTVMADDLAPETVFHAIAGWRVKGKWNPRTQRYVPSTAQQVFLLR